MRPRYCIFMLFALSTLITLVVISQSVSAGTSTGRVNLPLVARGAPFNPAVAIVGPVTRWTDSASGVTYIVGEVQNNTATAVKDIFVTAHFYDDDGSDLYITALGYPQPRSLYPRERGCFEVQSQHPAVRTNPFKFGQVRFNSRPPYEEQLAVTESTAEYDADAMTYTIRGRVWNDAPVVHVIYVIGTLFNHEGAVVGCRSSGAIAETPPTGREFPFVITFDGLDYANVTSYRVQARGTVFEPRNSAP